MAKKIDGYIKLVVPAGGATPAPPLGPALGQRGVNIVEFTKAFNAKTQDMERNMPIPTVITVYADKSFTFEIKTPPASYYLKKITGRDSGSNEPGRDIVASVTMAQCREIAEKKFPDLSANDLDAGAKIIAGSARSMGFEVTE